MRVFEYDSDVIYIQPVEASDTNVMKLGFQAVAVKRPLIAVKRIVEKEMLSNSEGSMRIVVF